METFCDAAGGASSSPDTWRTMRVISGFSGGPIMNWQEHITVDPAVVHGQACIRGTRVPVAVVLANLADGLSAEEIIRS